MGYWVRNLLVSK